VKHNKPLGIVALIAGSVIVALAVNGGQVVTCGKWTGCTSYGDPPEYFAGAIPFFFAGGIGLAAIGIFFLVSEQDSPKPPFDKPDRSLI
jgi:hypothetical protein